MILRHYLTVNAWCRAYVEYVNVDSIGACGDCDGVVVTVAGAVSWMEIANNAVFADIKISGTVGVLADGL